MTASGLYTTEEIYRLLPAVYRVRDAEQGGVLRELIDVLTDQVNVLAESLEQLYDDQFIETCADWVAPYIGDLVGYRTLHGVVPQVASPRAEVANTIRYRRRKGTVSVLEQLARDVTGWPARAVEFFELLATTQYMNHVRPHAAATADLRDDGAARARRHASRPARSTASPTPPRCAGSRRAPGRYNIPNVGIFLWRVAGAPPRALAARRRATATGRRFRFDPLGTDKPLFGSPRTETGDHAPRRAARRAAAAAAAVRSTAHLADLYGAGRVAPARGRGRGAARPDAPSPTSASATSPTTRRRRAPGRTSRSRPTRTSRSTRCSAASPSPPRPAAGETRLATFHYGSALAVGGGGLRPRRVARAARDTSSPSRAATALGPPLASVAGGGAVQILDSRRYAAPPTITATTPADRRRRPRGRPALREPRAAAARRAATSSSSRWSRTRRSSSNGLVLAGAPLVIEESADTEPRTLVLRHCTLVPGLTRDPDGEPHSLGRASLIVLHPFATVTLDHCVVGPIVAVEGAEVDRERLGDRRVRARTRSPSAAAHRRAAAACSRSRRAADRETGDGLDAGGHLDARRLHGRSARCTRSGSTSPNSLLLARARRTGRPVAGAGLGRAPPGRLHPLLVRPAGLAHAAPVPLRRRRPGAPRRSTPRCATATRLHAAAPLDARRRSARARATRARWASRTSSTSRSARRTCRMRLDEYLRFGLEAGFFYAT